MALSADWKKTLHYSGTKRTRRANGRYLSSEYQSQDEEEGGGEVPVVQRGEPPSSREPDRADPGADKKQSSRDRIKVNVLFCIFGPSLDIGEVRVRGPDRILYYFRHCRWFKSTSKFVRLVGTAFTYHCCGSASVVMQIRIQLFISMRIRIQKAKLLRINAAPDPGQPSKAQKY
jgi:hypothetical protein